MKHTHLKRLISALGASGAALVVGATQALACIPIATLNLSQTEAVPGTQITATMQQASSGAGPVTLHWNSATGPTLASATPGSSGGLTVTFAVPADAQGGYYTIVATQQLTLGTQTWGMPARAILHVTAPGGGPVNSQAPARNVSGRPAGLVQDQLPAAWLLALVALAAAAVGLILVGVAAVTLGRRSARPEAAQRS